MGTRGWTKPCPASDRNWEGLGGIARRDGPVCTGGVRQKQMWVGAAWTRGLQASMMRRIRSKEMGQRLSGGRSSQSKHGEARQRQGLAWLAHLPRAAPGRVGWVSLTPRVPFDPEPGRNSPHTYPQSWDPEGPIGAGLGDLGGSPQRDFIATLPNKTFRLCPRNRMGSSPGSGGTSQSESGGGVPAIPPAHHNRKEWLMLL